MVTFNILYNLTSKFLLKVIGLQNLAINIKINKFKILCRFYLWKSKVVLINFIVIIDKNFRIENYFGYLMNQLEKYFLKKIIKRIK